MFRSSTSGSDSEAQVGFLFHVMIGINPLGEFRSVKGIGRTVEKIEISEGGRNHAPHTRAGQGKYNECTIEWGMSNRTTLYDWIHAVEAGYGYKRLVWVVQLGRDRIPLRIYQLIDAWPTTWKGADLDANNNQVDTEEITIAYEAVVLMTMPVSTPSMAAIPDVLVSDVNKYGGQAHYVDFGESAPLTKTKGVFVPDEQELTSIKLTGGGTPTVAPNSAARELQTLGKGLLFSDGFMAVRTEPVKLVFGKPNVEDEEKEEKKDEEKDEEPTDDEPTDDEPTPNGEPTKQELPAPLKMSGGIFFERSVFLRPALVANAHDEKADDDA